LDLMDAKHDKEIYLHFPSFQYKIHPSRNYKLRAQGL